MKPIGYLLGSYLALCLAVRYIAYPAILARGDPGYWILLAGPSSGLATHDIFAYPLAFLLPSLAFLSFAIGATLAHRIWARLCFGCLAVTTWIMTGLWVAKCWAQA